MTRADLEGEKRLTLDMGGSRVKAILDTVFPLSENFEATSVLVSWAESVRFVEGGFMATILAKKGSRHLTIFSVQGGQIALNSKRSKDDRGSLVNIPTGKLKGINVLKDSDDQVYGLQFGSLDGRDYLILQPDGHYELAVSMTS